MGAGGLDRVAAHVGGVVVVELASYPTDLSRSLTPDVAVFTGLSPDHLDRHGGRGGYFAAKRRLFAEGGPERAVIGVDEPEGLFLAGQTAMGQADDRVIQVMTSRKPAGVGWTVAARKGFLSEMRKGRQTASIDLRGIDGLPGAHNHQNACSAYAACRAIGIGPRAIEAALRSFKGLPHRSQLLGERNGVRFVNDSKATNVQSAAMALNAFQNIRWIAGGQGKDGGLSGIGAGLAHVSKAYLIGEAAVEFATQLGNSPHQVCGDLQTAFAAALSDAQPGDTVLLAPAAASFDQFASFEERGEAFEALVRRVLA